MTSLLTRNDSIVYSEPPRPLPSRSNETDPLPRSLARADPFALLKRQRGGGRFPGVRQQLDGKLDPGNKGGQGQGASPCSSLCTSRSVLRARAASRWLGDSSLGPALTKRVDGEHRHDQPRRHRVAADQLDVWLAQGDRRHRRPSEEPLRAFGSFLTWNSCFSPSAATTVGARRITARLQLRTADLSLRNSLTRSQLDPSQIAKGLAQDGTTGAGSEAGASSRSSLRLASRAPRSELSREVVSYARRCRRERHERQQLHQCLLAED